MVSSNLSFVIIAFLETQIFFFLREDFKKILLSFFKNVIEMDIIKCLYIESLAYMHHGWVNIDLEQGFSAVALTTFEAG